MRDRYWYQMDLSQLRIEVSRRVCCAFEIGTMVTVGTGDDADALTPANTMGLLNNVLPFTPTRIEATDQYTIFVRRPVGQGGDAKFWAGMTGKGDALLGSEVWLPVTNGLAVEGNFGYLFSNEGGNLGRTEKSFGLGLNFVWYPYNRARQSAASPFRPLFPVANNSRFFFNFK